MKKTFKAICISLLLLNIIIFPSLGSVLSPESPEIDQVQKTQKARRQVAIKALGTTDFTIRIPVNLRNAPKIKKIRVRVAVGKGGGSIWVETNQIGFSQTEIPISNGRYENTIVLKFNANRGKNPAEAVNWIAQIFLSGDSINYFNPEDAERRGLILIDKTKPFRWGATGKIE